ncbi:CLUMA_CG000027, isoform A [Clunio marinus]|uniref:Sugar phosphate exchanger 3 n=1 Tax=Clunio marinus TaxID=568069 RepID=A0A1J1HEC3_9DIPT|nr:CLUMA_CG000027, isoform A [Clunio marinus]
MPTSRRQKMSINSPPIGVTVLAKLTSNVCPSIHFNRFLLYKTSVLVLTYVAYVCYHMTRKPIAVVKSVLHQNCSDLPRPSDFKINSFNDETWCDYAPFDGSDASALLGILDSSFLFCYAIAMFFSGLIAERVSLRYYLSLGMLLSGFFCYTFGYAKTKDVHSLAYFVIVQSFAGIFQTTGWPGVVTVVSRWCGKSKRGLILGIWNSHTSIGNMLGTYIAAHYVATDWSMSFIVPGFIMGIVGFIIFLFLVDSPEIVGMQHEVTAANPEDTSNYRRFDDSDESGLGEVTIRTEHESNPSLRSLRGSLNSESQRYNERTPMLGMNSNHHETPIGFIGALKIPGVIEFSLCLFFSKLVNYTFLFWLPLYIKNTTPLTPEASAELSMVFDIGGIVGAIATGVISDTTSMPASTCVGMLFVAAPLLFIYETYGALSWLINVSMLFVLGLFVNGPYALITTSVSAELGQHKSLEGNGKALATVTSIIDGTGSIGAAVGPLIAGLVQAGGWQNVFYMLISSNIIAMLLLFRLVRKEFSKLNRRRNNIRIE